MVSSLSLLKWHAEDDVIFLNALHNFSHKFMKWVAEFERPFPSLCAGRKGFKKMGEFRSPPGFWKHSEKRTLARKLFLGTNGC